VGPTFDPGFTTPEMMGVFSPANTVAAILRFEAALAVALADAGIAPNEAKEAIAGACLEDIDDPGEILASTWRSGTPIIALVDAIRSRIDDPGHREWVHHGATSQDAIDTGRMLQVQSGFQVLERETEGVARSLGALVVRYRKQPHMARTFLQDARPTTFGARAAGWLSQTLDALAGLRQNRESLRVQLGGPSGSLVELGQSAGAVTAAVAGQLGLVAPLMCWHADRSPVWRVAGVVGVLSRTMAKIATDIALLAQSSVAEVRVRPGGSSSMPGKANPMDAVRVVAAAHACDGFADMLTGAPTIELDRGVGGWHQEWLALPMLFQTAAAAVEGMAACLYGLEVDGEQMASRVDGEGRAALLDADFRSVDAVLFRLEAEVGPV
jgi:3-carboxy-cis,cis-muconate cycloisomerase